MISGQVSKSQSPTSLNVNFRDYFYKRRHSVVNPNSISGLEAGIFGFFLNCVVCRACGNLH